MSARTVYDEIYIIAPFFFVVVTIVATRNDSDGDEYCTQLFIQSFLA